MAAMLLGSGEMEMFAGGKGESALPMYLLLIVFGILLRQILVNTSPALGAGKNKGLDTGQSQ